MKSPHALDISKTLKYEGFYAYQSNFDDSTLTTSSQEKPVWNCVSSVEFTYAVRYNFTEIDLYLDLGIKINSTGPAIIRKNGVVQAFIKKFGNAFDEDIELVFPKKVDGLVVEVVVGSGESVSANQILNEVTGNVDITNLVEFVENESVAEEFRVKIKKSDLVSNNAEKISVYWSFKRYLEFRLSEIFIV